MGTAAACAAAVLAYCGAAFAADLSLAVGGAGLTSIQYRGQELLANNRAGELRAVQPKLRWPDGTLTTPLDIPRVEKTGPSRITSHYSWGQVECTYSQHGAKLQFAIRVTNTSGAVFEAHSLQLMELGFSSIPQGKNLDAGMFGMGTKWSPLPGIALKAFPAQMPPIVLVRSEEGMLAFVSDEDPSAANSPVPSVPFTTNAATKLTYPFLLAVGPVVPGATLAVQASLRFGELDSGVEELAGDVLQRYRDAFPFTLDWPDRRAIGALFLATSQKHPEKNPRGWFLNAKDVDLTTAEGVAAWRARLMKYAQTSISILKEIDAQGMITWDVEGEEFAGATYYGDPRLASTLAPETAVNGALDEYFAMFRDAGFRTGLTIRPQHIVFEDGKPKQKEVADPLGELIAKIEYARQRWDCTLFYVDSTYDSAGSLNADVFRAIAQRFPDILLFPENENLRDFAYSAPLNSYHHHNVTGTPASVLDVYPGAFSILMATTTDEKMAAGRDALLESVRRGDILLVNAWTRGKHIDFVKGIYQEAAR